MNVSKVQDICVQDKTLCRRRRYDDEKEMLEEEEAQHAHESQKVS